jgi:hypothetical protein
MTAKAKMFFYVVILAVSIVIVVFSLIRNKDFGAKMSEVTSVTKKTDAEVTVWKDAPNYDVIPKSAATKEEVDLSEKLAKYIKGARAEGVSGIILKEEHSDSGLLLSLIIQNASKSDSFLVSANGESVVFGWKNMEIKVRESGVCEAIITSDESFDQMSLSYCWPIVKNAGERSSQAATMTGWRIRSNLPMG